MATITGIKPRTKTIVRPARKIPQAKAPRIRKPVVRPRGPRVLTLNPTQTDSPGDAPIVSEIGSATLPEWYVWWYLTRRAKLLPNVEFEFQSSLFGGRRELGGLVVDFLLRDRFSPGLVVNVQGYHWHRYSTRSRATDVLTKIRLQSAPYFFTVVYVLEDDLLHRLGSTMTAALAGTQLYEDNV